MASSGGHSCRGCDEPQPSKGSDATEPASDHGSRPFLLTPSLAWPPGLRGATGGTGHDNDVVRRFFRDRRHYRKEIDERRARRDQAGTTMRAQSADKGPQRLRPTERGRADLVDVRMRSRSTGE